MPRITPLHYKALIKIFQKAGFSITGEASSHLKMNKKGVLRPVIIPKYPEVGLDIITGLLRTAGMSRDDYFLLQGIDPHQKKKDPTKKIPGKKKK